MARSTKTTRSSARRGSEPTLKKRLGRPLGSKNQVKPSALTKAASVGRTTRAAPRKAAAPAAPKLSKAELKQTARMEAREAAEAAPAPVVEAMRAPKSPTAPAVRRKTAAAVQPAAEAPATPAAAKRTSRRSTRSKTPPVVEPDVEQEPSTPEGHEDEVDPEA